MSRWLGITQSQLSRIESGKNEVRTVKQLINYAKCLKIPPELLWFEFEPNENPPSQNTGGVFTLPDGPIVAAASLRTESALTDSLMSTLEQYANTDNLAGPRSLTAVVPEQIRFIEKLLQDARGKDHARLLYVGGRYAELAGWLYQDTGDLNSAMQYSNIALDFAHEAGNVGLASFVLMRKSNIASDARRPDLALRLADAALENPNKLTARLQAVALRQEAHAFAQTGNADACARSLDRAFELATQRVDGDTDLGNFCTPEYLEMEAAHCWVELGQPGKAIATLQRGLAGWQPLFRRDLGLCLARLAVAYARDEQPENAVIVADRSLEIVRQTRSYRTERELGRVPDILVVSGAEEQARKLSRQIKLLS